ncbi:MAG: hypothetical protein SFW66_10560 [Gammaproteobacteria bacterium]|nr:hypothetical protein [Gammaproteobacteria bacterium]
MINKITLALIKIKQWIKTCSLKQRIGLFLGFILITWLLWQGLLFHPVTVATQKKIDEIKTLQQKITELTVAGDSIEKKARDAQWKQQMQKNKQLDDVLQQLTQQMRASVNQAISVKQLPQLTADILSAQQAILIDAVRNFPTTPWVASPIEGVVLPDNISNIQKFPFEIVFHGQFTESVEYLNRLSRLPWRISWDTLHYQVSKWPEADIRVSFHVLGQQKTGIS